MTKAGYDYGITDGVIWIIDQDTSKMSVTNDIENVVEEIAKKENIMKLTPVVYRDSQGIWDGWDHAKGGFIHLGTKTRQHAIAKIINIWPKIKRSWK